MPILTRDALLPTIKITQPGLWILFACFLFSSFRGIAYNVVSDSLISYTGKQLDEAREKRNTDLQGALRITTDLLKNQSVQKHDSLYNYVKYTHSLYLLLLNENIRSKEMIMEILPYYKQTSQRRWTILLVRLGSLNIRLGNYEEAQDYLNRALPLTQTLDLPISYGMIYLYLSDMHQLKSDYGNAYKMADSALQVFQTIGRDDWISTAQTSLAYICILVKNFEDAAVFLDRIFREAEDIENKNFLVRPLLYSGIMHFEQGNIPQARKQLEEGLEKTNSMGNYPDLTLIYQYISKICIMEKEYEKASNYINQALSYSNLSMNKKDLFDSKIILINLELITNPEKNNLAEAKEIYDWALENEDYVLLKESSEYLSEYHVRHKDYQNALKYKEVYANASEKKSEKERLDEILILREKNKFEHEAHERELNEKKLELQLVANQKIKNYMIISLCILLAMTGLLLYYFNQKRKANMSLHVTNQELHKAERTLAFKNAELQKYIESNIQLEQFAHVASHDLRAPLITINSFAKLLDETASGKLDENEKTFIHYIRANGEQMYELVNDLLEYSKINSQKINISQVDVQQLVENIISMLQNQADENNVSLKISTPLPVIYADEIKLKRVFQNLISNAIKFSDPTKDSFVEISGEEDMDNWTFSVKDNGIGIKTPKIDIFQPYVQLNRKSEYKGTGLGLSFCQKIIQQHDGKINYNSQFGQGSTFYFTISRQLTPDNR
ncbi:MAG: ATP-binding protein [Bacteroidia bacterium]